MMNKKLQEIFQKNAEFEKETPCNFCDRWCERCDFNTQNRCKLYLENFDRRVTNIAYGRDEDDSEILEEDLKKHFESIESFVEQWAEKEDFDFLDIDYNTYDELKQKEEQLRNHSLQKITQQYMSKTHEFLKEFFYEKGNILPSLRYDYETVVWYHTLLSAKTYRALCGLYAHDNDDEYDFGLCDAVAQLAVCKKAIMQSVKALRNIAEKNNCLQNKIFKLLTLLHNIFSRIQFIESEI